jgi:hypothetical protein
MNTSAFLGSQRKEESHGFHPCHRGEGIVEVDAFPLHKIAYHQASLVLDDGTGFIPLQLEHPLKGDHAVTTREISKLLGAILLNCVHLRLHRRRRKQDATAPPDREGPVPAPAGRREGSPSYDTTTAAYSPSSLEVEVLDGEVVVHQSRVVVHRCPMPIFALRRTLRRTSCAHSMSRVKNAVGLRAIRVADEHPWSAPVVELADVANLLAEREAAEDS